MSETAMIVRNMDDAERAARAMSASGFFADTKQASQAIVKILAGHELGFGPFASMTGVHIIQNKPVLAANLMAAAVKRNGKYNYRVIEATDKACVIEWIEAGQSVGRSSFTWEEAQAAGLTGKDNWKKYPSDMLFARAISRGQKRYAPDIFNGATVYTPDEMGAQVDEEGNAIVEAEVAKPEIKPPAISRPYSPEQLKAKLAERAEKNKGKICTDMTRKVTAAALGKLFADDTTRYEFTKWATGTASTKAIAPEYVLALQDWMACHTFEAVPDQTVINESQMAHAAALVEAGQMTLEEGR